MKKVIAIGVLFSTLTIFSCTKESMSIQEPEVKPDAEKVVLKATEGRAILAEILARSLNDKKVTKELSTILSRKRDGEPEILLEEVLPSNELGVFSLYTSLDRSFAEKTKEKNLLSVFTNFGSFAQELIRLDPLVQIAFRGIEEDSSVINLEKEDILVVYLPENFNDRKETTLVAYDKNRNKYDLNSSEEPEVSAIVIGSNERLRYVKKGTSVAGKQGYGKLYFRGLVYDYYFQSNIIGV